MKWEWLVGAAIALAYAYYSESLSGLERLALNCNGAVCTLDFRLAEVKDPPLLGPAGCPVPR